MTDFRPKPTSEIYRLLTTRASYFSDRPRCPVGKQSISDEGSSRRVPGQLLLDIELVGLGQIGQQRQALGKGSPVLAKLIRRPRPLHRPTPSSLGVGGYGLEADSIIADGQNAQLRGQ